MTFAGFLVFSATYLLAVATPGPGIAALVARVLTRGTSGIWAFIAGMALGDVIWLAIAATGLAAIAHTWAPLLVAIRLAGAAYLLFVAFKLWTAPPGAVAASDAPAEPPLRQFASALSLTLGNPKVIGFFVALLPALIDLDHLTLRDFALVAALCAVLLAAVAASYALAAHRARRFFASPRAMQRLNRSAGAVMAGAAAMIAARQ